jgi:hypothetical protein
MNGGVTLAGSFGSTLVNHGGAIWDISGASTFGAGSNFIKNEGIINVSGLSSVTATGTLSIYGTGSIVLSDGATFEVNATVTAGQTVIFTTTTTSETLKIDQSLTLPFNAAISGLTSNVHDTIDLVDLPFGPNTSVYYTALTSNSGTLTVSDGLGHIETFSLVNYTGSGNFTATSDGAAGTSIADPPVFGSDAAPAVSIAAGTTVELADDASSAVVTFQSSSGTLQLEHSSTFTGQISGFTGDGTLAGSDQIDLRDINLNSTQFNATYDSQDDILTVTDGSNTTNLHFVGNYVLGNFKFATDGNGGTIIYDPPVQDQNAAQVVNGTTGNDTLVTSAANQALSGLGGSDAFVFRPNFGHDTITDFKPGSDTINIDHTLVTDINSLLSSATVSGNDTVIHDTVGDTITLKNVALVNLHTNDFHLI